jgi:methyl-accepting chemotaxis protein
VNEQIKHYLYGETIMKNLSLNFKMAIVIAVLMAGGVFIAIYGLSVMSTIKDSLNEVTGVFVKRDQLTSLILDRQRENTIANKSIIIEKNPAKMEAIEKDINEQIRPALLKSVEEYTAIASPEGKELITKYQTAIEKWFVVNKEIRQLSKAGKDDEASKATDEREAPLRLEALGILTKMNELTAKNLSTATKLANEQYESARFTLIIATIIVFSVAGFLAVMILLAIGKSIDQIIRSLNDNAAQVSSASQQIASSAEEMSQAATEQASSLEETSSAVEEMTTMIKKNAEGAKSSTDIAHGSSQAAMRGKQVVSEMVSAMKEINEANSNIMNEITSSNQRISEIVKVIAEIGNKTKVINEIVFQTKLLSFNASVEAARAGEHGKGFAVVAEEVGNLAQMSGNAAKEISTMLDSSIKTVETTVTETKTNVESLVSTGRSKVELGNEVAKKCGEVLDEIVSSVGSVTSMVGDIATASDEQARGIEEISRAMTQLDQVTQQNAAVSEESASAAEELSAQAESLQGVVKALIRTIKGTEGHTDQVVSNPHPTAGIHAPKIHAATGHTTQPTHGTHSKLIHIGAKKPYKVKNSLGESSIPTIRKAVGDDMIPSEDDTRFKDV